MQTFVVEVLNEKAVPLLRDLENLDIIRLIPQGQQPEEQPGPTLSEQFRGSISKDLAADLHRQLTEMRNEWK